LLSTCALSQITISLTTALKLIFT